MVYFQLQMDYFVKEILWIIKVDVSRNFKTTMEVRQETNPYKVCKQTQFQYTLTLSPMHYVSMQHVLETCNTLSFCAHYIEFKILK